VHTGKSRTERFHRYDVIQAHLWKVLKTRS
jgi:hypothetical protein